MPGSAAKPAKPARHVCNTGGVTCPAMHLVTPGVYLGSALAARDVARLMDCGVRAVLSVGGGDSEASEVRATGLVLVCSGERCCQLPVTLALLPLRARRRWKACASMCWTCPHTTCCATCRGAWPSSQNVGTPRVCRDLALRPSRTNCAQSQAWQPGTTCSCIVHTASRGAHRLSWVRRGVCNARVSARRATVVTVARAAWRAWYQRGSWRVTG